MGRHERANRSGPRVAARAGPCRYRLAPALPAAAGGGPANRCLSTSNPRRRRTAYARDFHTNGEHPLWRNMATSQNSHTPRRRPSVGDRSGTGTATPPGTDPTPDSTNDTGHPNARGTLPMARHPFAPPTTDLGEAQAPAPAGVSAADRAIMRARLAVMAAPRDSDDAELAALRAVLRDEALMAHVIANVERWPPLTEEQRETIAASQPGAATGGLNRMATHDDGAPTDSGGAPWCPGRLRGAGGLPSGAWVRCPPRSGRTPPASPGRQDRHGAQPV